LTHLWNLPQADLFADLTLDERETVLEFVSVKAFARRDLLFQPGDTSKCLFLLNHGRVKAYNYTSQGQKRIMQVLFPGDVFGGLLLGTDHGELPWAQAIDDVVVSSMDEPAFMRFMQLFPVQCLAIIRNMTFHHSEDMHRLETFLHTDASHRLVLIMLHLGDRLGYRHDEKFELDSSFTHEELANMIGVVRSTVSHLIGALRRAKVLSGRGRRLIIDRQAAQQYLNDS
jgi:CRP/FNR family transcriptional regulator